MSPSNTASAPMTPRTGMLATVCNRRGLIRAIEPFDSTLEGRVYLVSLEYLDADGSSEETLIWEREPKARLLEPTALPDSIRDAPMPPTELDALVRASAAGRPHPGRPARGPLPAPGRHAVRQAAAAPAGPADPGQQR